ncbi:MAG: VOC family protein [Cytophagales bacterium]|nr:VOC family protein [Cytophaga sp.]
MGAISTYLNFPGNTEEAFNFYKSVLGGEFLNLQRFKDVPGNEQINVIDRDKLMHITLRTAKRDVLMAADVLESHGQMLTTGNNFSLSINAESEAEAVSLLKGLSAGGQVTMPLEKTFWNAYFGMWTDKFGIQCMVNYDYK